MTYDTEYRGYRIRRYTDGCNIYDKDYRLFGWESNIKHAKQRIDEDIVERDVSPDTVLSVVK